MIVRVHAGWVLPIATPALRDGWLDVDTSRGEIVAVGARDAAPSSAPDTAIDLGNAVILPGLVNAHTHLELSHLAGRVPPAAAFVPWVRSMLAARFGAPVPEPIVVAAVGDAIVAMEATGTAAVGDIGNTDVAVGPLLASELHGVHFREALAFRPEEAPELAAETLAAARRTQQVLAATRGRLVAATAPHAPYSTSAPLIRALAQGLPETGGVASMHLGESREELEFLAHGTGPFRALLQDLGKWDDRWQPPATGPIDYLQSLDALHARLLVVHGTQLTTDALRAIAASGATLVLCGRSNRWVGAGQPPVAEAMAAGVAVAIGTDSLASVEDLNLFEELAYLREIAPDVSAHGLLRAATLGGARALGCHTLGVLGPGASSRALVRTPPAGVTDVEEWLVAGAADTHDLRWLDAVVLEHLA